MGVYYYYANLTKREIFCIDALGGAIKRNALGRTLATRAFHLMLVNSGRWAGDQIAIFGDDITPDWERICEEFVDIEANAILTIFREDGFEEIGEQAKSDSNLFMELCHLVVTRRAVELEPGLKETFGHSYLQRYKQLCKDKPWFKPKDLRE